MKFNTDITLRDLIVFFIASIIAYYFTIYFNKYKARATRVNLQTQQHIILQNYLAYKKDFDLADPTMNKSIVANNVLFRSDDNFIEDNETLKMYGFNQSDIYINEKGFQFFITKNKNVYKINDRGVVKCMKSMYLTNSNLDESKN